MTSATTTSSSTRTRLQHALNEIIKLSGEFDDEWKRADVASTFLQKEFIHLQLGEIVQQLRRDWDVVKGHRDELGPLLQGGIDNLGDKIDNFAAQLKAFDFRVKRPQKGGCGGAASAGSKGKKGKKKSVPVVELEGRVPPPPAEIAPSANTETADVVDDVEPSQPLEEVLEPYFSEMRTTMESQAGEVSELSEKVSQILGVMKGAVDQGEHQATRLEVLEEAMLQQAGQINSLESTLSKQQAILEMLAHHTTSQSATNDKIMAKLEAMEKHSDKMINKATEAAKAAQKHAQALSRQQQHGVTAAAAPSASSPVSQQSAAIAFGSERPFGLLSEFASSFNSEQSRLLLDDLIGNSNS
eukprot:PhM_4_TR9998/c0_g1_i1/m.3598